MTASLTPAELERLRNILGRLSSDYEGERAAAGLLATRLLRDKGLGWDEVVLPHAPSRPAAAQRRQAKQTWRQIVQDLLARPGSLRAWEKDFLPSLLRFQRLSLKQRNCLDKSPLVFWGVAGHEFF